MQAKKTPSYSRALEQVPRAERAALEAYCWGGILPTGSLLLMSLLSGDLSAAVKLYDAQYPHSRYSVVAISAFVEDHFGDLAMGHPSLMLRWHDWGGADGRNAANDR